MNEWLLKVRCRGSGMLWWTTFFFGVVMMLVCRGEMRLELRKRVLRIHA